MDVGFVKHIEFGRLNDDLKHFFFNPIALKKYIYINIYSYINALLFKWNVH